MQNVKKLYLLEWEKKVLARLPEAYNKFYKEWKWSEPSPVHYIPQEGKWTINPDTMLVERVKNTPIELQYPPESHQGMWGGEGLIKGYVRPDPDDQMIAKYWFPVLKRSTLYSEILNKHFSTIVTDTTLQKIDDNFGFDSYLFKTPACDLQSLLACSMKRTLMLILIDNIADNTGEKSRLEELKKKYEPYLLPREEAEWYGYDLYDASLKLLRQQEAIAKVAPLKHKYRKQYIEELKSRTNVPKDSTSILSRMNPFKRSSLPEQS